MVEFNSTNLDLAGINKYLKTNEIQLSETEHQTLNTIFDACDTYDEDAKADGKDGKLNGNEWQKFIAEAKEKLPNLLKSLCNYKYQEEANAVMRAELSKTAPADAVNVNTDIIETPVIASENQEPELPIPESINKNSDIRTNYDWSEEEFNKVLSEMLDAPKYGGKFKNSVLRGQGKAFIEAGKKFNIDPRVLVSIAMVESERGISRKARELNNVGGLIINGKYHHFDTVSHSIDSIAKTVSTRYDEGFTTLTKIGNSGRYCEKGVAPSWINQGSSYFKFFEKYYNPQEE